MENQHLFPITLRNIWFDKVIMMCWLVNMFWIWHLKHHGNVTDLTPLDNCTANHIEMSNLPPNLSIEFIPPNYMSKHQPEEMETIKATKIG